jgi:hypothetical protein
VRGAPVQIFVVRAVADEPSSHRICTVQRR